MTRREPTDLDRRKTGGAGSLTHPLTDSDYRREMRKLERLAAVDSETDGTRTCPACDGYAPADCPECGGEGRVPGDDPSL